MALLTCAPLVTKARAAETKALAPGQSVGVAHTQSLGVTVTLLSEQPTGDPDVDRINIRYFAAADSLSVGPRPAIVFLPPLGSHSEVSDVAAFARFLAERGIGVAVMTLPYNGRRQPGKGKTSPARFYSGSDPFHNARSFTQAASDVRTVVTWLSSQKGVDPARLGVGGISLGAIVVHIAMGIDERLGVGVAILGTGDLPELYRNGLLSYLERLRYPNSRSWVSREKAIEAFARIDPLVHADRNRPRRVLMVQGARDLVMPPRAATRLWKALGRPPIRWVDGGHFAPGFNRRGMQQAAWEYFRAAWGLDGAAIDPTFTPGLSVPTIKLGLLAQASGPNSLGTTPALTWQALSFGHRPDHLGLVHVDLGLTGRGPFLGIAATLTRFLDLGIASRIDRLTVAPPRPYLSLHFTF